MTEFQIEACYLTHKILSSKDYYKNLKKSGFKDILISLIRQYSEINSEGIKTWKKVELYKKHHKISIRASKIIENYTGKKNEMWKQLHYEHIVPVSIIYKKLLNIGFKPKISAIKKVLKSNEVIIISKEESIVLDGSPKKRYLLNGELVNGKGLKSKGEIKERLNSINAIIDKKYINNKL